MPVAIPWLIAAFVAGGASGFVVGTGTKKLLVLGAAATGAYLYVNRGS